MATVNDEKNGQRPPSETAVPLGESTSVDAYDGHGVQHKRKRSTWHKVQAFIWDDPDKPEAEKRFLRKLDFYLLTYTCLGYFVRGRWQAASPSHVLSRSS